MKYTYEKEDYRKMSSAVRFLAADMIEKAKSGHPGVALGMADVATILFSEFLKINPQDGHWFDRDRFVLSAGHGSAMLYSLLYLCGYKDINIDDIKNFRQLGSKTAGHPEIEKISGIDMSTGPLGQGLSSAVGMAVAERKLNTKFGDDLCNHYTYVIAGDGCLMEGISEEAISIAGHLKLNKLIVFWDNNNITIDGKVELVSSVNQIMRFQAAGWNTIEIDGHNYLQIRDAIETAQKSKKPTLIACKTIIGYGATTKSGTPKCHGSPLGSEEIANMRKNLQWNYPEFEIPENILQKWRNVSVKSLAEYKKWCDCAEKLGDTFKNYINCNLPKNWNIGLSELKKQAIQEKFNIATRKASNLCISKIVNDIEQIVGGSADLAASNLTFVEGMKNITADDYSGNNIMYGIREHVMGAILNGMALHGGIIPFGGTFFVFSDYLRPAVRLSSLMKLGVIYVFTHDSIGVGEDGPSHQPIEHLASFRAMPGIYVFRPCDTVETAEAWEIALQNRKTPSLLTLSRQNLPTLRKNTDVNYSSMGAYIISPCHKKCQATIIATGSEVSLAVQAQEQLLHEDIDVSVVSMPCTELFEEQTSAYRKSILGEAPRVVVEAASKFGLERYAGDNGEIIAIDSFGESGKADEVYKHFGITVENIIKTVKTLIK